MNDVDKLKLAGLRFKYNSALYAATDVRNDIKWFIDKLEEEGDALAHAIDAVPCEFCGDVGEGTVRNGDEYLCSKCMGEDDNDW